MVGSERRKRCKKYDGGGGGGGGGGARNGLVLCVDDVKSMYVSM